MGPVLPHVSQNNLVLLCRPGSLNNTAHAPSHSPSCRCAPKRCKQWFGLRVLCGLCVLWVSVAVAFAGLVAGCPLIPLTHLAILFLI